MLVLDHLAVVAQTLDAGRAHVEKSLGVTLSPGGQHAHFGTHNALLGLEDGLYLEVIAIDPAAPKPGFARWFDLDRFEGAPRLANWICRSDDLEAALAQMPGAGQPVGLTRGDLRWRMAVPENGVLPFDGTHPAVMQWQVSTHPATRLPPSHCRLERLILSHPEAGRLQDALAGRIDDPRLIFETGSDGLRAEFTTPAGPRMLA